MLPLSCRQVVTRLRAVNTNSRNERVWTDPDRLDIRGCSIQMSTTSGDLSSRDNSQLQAILYAPPTADIKRGDRIEYCGNLYVVDGHPMLQEGLTGNLAHLNVRLTCWEG